MDEALPVTELPPRRAGGAQRFLGRGRAGARGRPGGVVGVSGSPKQGGGGSASTSARLTPATSLQRHSFPGGLTGLPPARSVWPPGAGGGGLNA